MREAPASWAARPTPPAEAHLEVALPAAVRGLPAGSPSEVLRPRQAATLPAAPVASPQAPEGMLLRVAQALGAARVPLEAQPAAGASLSEVAYQLSAVLRIAVWICLAAECQLPAALVWTAALA